MRMSELSRVSGVAVPRVQFYLREHLLPPGRATAATQARYDEEHLARLRLVRALVDVGRLPLAAVRSGLDTVETGADPTPGAVAWAHDARRRTVADVDDPPARAFAAVETLGWHVDRRSTALHPL